MAASKDDVLRTALALPEQERADLVVALIGSLDAEAEQGAEEAWLVEVERRAKELESGVVQSIPWDVVRAQLLRASRE